MLMPTTKKTGKTEQNILSIVFIPFCCVLVIIADYIILDGARRLAFPLLVFIISLLCIKIFKPGMNALLDGVNCVLFRILYFINLLIRLNVVLFFSSVEKTILAIKRLLSRNRSKFIVKNDKLTAQIP